MRTLNVKATVIFLIVLTVVVGSTHLLHSYQVSRHSTLFRTMAREAWNATPRRADDAIQCMTNYLSIEPNDFEAVKDLGFWQAETGRFNAAANRLEELLRMLEKNGGPDKHKEMMGDIHRELVQIYMKGLKKWADAEGHLEALLQDYPLDRPQEIDIGGAALLQRLAECQRHQRQEKEAIESYTKALANPKNRGRYDIYRDWAMTLRYATVMKPDIAAAEEVMKKMIAVPENAKSPEAHDVYAFWLDELGDVQSTREDVEKVNERALDQATAALALKNDDTGGLYMAGKCEKNLQQLVDKKKRDYSKAEDYVRRGLKAAPQETSLYILLADIYGCMNRQDQQIRALKEGIQTLKSTYDKSTLLWSLANLYLDGHNGAVDAASMAAAKECIRQLQEYRLSKPQLKFLEARVLYANNEWKAFLDVFEKEDRPDLPQDPKMMKCLYYWIGYCYLQQGNPDKADIAFHRALKYDEFDFKAHDGLAQIYYGRGQVENAVKEYRQAAAGNPENGDAWVAYARALLTSTLQKKEQERDLEFLVSELEKAKKHVSDGRLDMYWIDALVSQGNAKGLEQAEEMLKELQKVSPNSTMVYVAQANLEARHGHLDKARAILDGARAKLGDDYTLRLARASYARDSEHAGAEIEKLAENVAAYSTDEKINLMNGLLNNLMGIGDFERAKAIGRQIALLQPHDATIRYRLLELDLRTHNFREPAESLAEIDRLLGEIENIAGQGPLWYYGKAVRLRLEAGSKNANPELLRQAMEMCARRRSSGTAGRGPACSWARFAASRAKTTRPCNTTSMPPSMATAIRSLTAFCCRCSRSGSATTTPSR